MTRQKVFAYVKEQYGTEPDYPWSDDNAVLRHSDNNKWYGVVLTVSRVKLGLDGDGLADVLNIKCDPLLIGAFRTQPGYYPAYHMNKEKWLSVLLDGTAPDDEIMSLIDISFNLTASKIKAHRNCQHRDGC